MIDKLKKNWVLVLFLMLITGVLVAYSVKSGRYLVLMMWILLPLFKIIYERLDKKKKEE